MYYICVFLVLLATGSWKYLHPQVIPPAADLIPEVGTEWGRREGVVFSMEGDYFKFRYDISSQEFLFPWQLMGHGVPVIWMLVQPARASLHVPLEAPNSFPFYIKQCPLQHSFNVFSSEGPGENVDDSVWAIRTAGKLIQFILLSLRQWLNFA